MGTQGALAARASGCTTIVPGSNGGFAGAADDLLDASNSKFLEELSGIATIVLGHTGGCAAAATDLHDAANSTGAFSLIDVNGIVFVEGDGEAATVQVDTCSTALSLPSGSLIRGSRSNSQHHPILCAFSSCQ